MKINFSLDIEDKLFEMKIDRDCNIDKLVENAVKRYLSDKDFLERNFQRKIADEYSLKILKNILENENDIFISKDVFSSSHLFKKFHRNNKKDFILDNCEKSNLLKILGFKKFERPMKFYGSTVRIFYRRSLGNLDRRQIRNHMVEHARKTSEKDFME